MEKIKQALFNYTGLNTQIIKFLIVGGTTFTIDYLCLIVLVELFGLNYLLSAAIGFIIGSVINYLLSVKFVFVSGKYKKVQTEFTIFMIFTVMGLGLNHFVMYAGADIIELDYRIAKVISLIIVTSFNFVNKKLFVFLK